MGIDVCFVEIDGDQWDVTEEGDRVASTGAFINLAMQLSLIIEPMRELDLEPVKFALGALKEFVEHDREAKLAAFADYADFIVEVSRKMHEEAEVVIAGPPPELNVEVIDEDVRAYLSGFMLSKAPVPPGVCDQLGPFTGVALGLFNAYAEQLEESDPQVARALHEAYQSLDVARNYCDIAADEGRYIYFDF